jgi:hypothetical protein
MTRESLLPVINPKSVDSNMIKNTENVKRMLKYHGKTRESLIFLKTEDEMQV